MKKKLGKLGERIAKEFLEKKNYEIIAQNYHSRYGEIDIICKGKENLLIFVEVKTRQKSFQDAFNSVGFSKQKKIYKTAEHFYFKNQKYENHSSRFDVIAIITDKKKGKNKIRHMKNAFSPIFF